MEPLSRFGSLIAQSASASAPAPESVPAAGQERSVNTHVQLMKDWWVI